MESRLTITKTHVQLRATYCHIMTLGKLFTHVSSNSDSLVTAKGWQFALWTGWNALNQRNISFTNVSLSINADHIHQAAFEHYQVTKQRSQIATNCTALLHYRWQVQHADYFQFFILLNKPTSNALELLSRCHGLPTDTECNTADLSSWYLVQGSHSLGYKKFQDFSGTKEAFFQDHVVSRQYCSITHHTTHYTHFSSTERTVPA